jgi:hypothetical protein
MPSTTLLQSIQGFSFFGVLRFNEDAYPAPVDVNDFLDFFVRL